MKQATADGAEKKKKADKEGIRKEEENAFGRKVFLVYTQLSKSLLKSDVRFYACTRVKTHKLLQVCKQVVTSLFTSCQQVVFALLVPSLL